MRSPSLLHEVPDELRNLMRCGIERKMARIEDVDFGLRHVAAIARRFRQLERQVVFAPEDEKPGLLLAHPSLPLGVGVDVRAVVVEEVALNVGLSGLVEKGKFIGPEIRIIAFQVGIVPDGASASSAATGDLCEAHLRWQRDRPKRPAVSSNSPPGLRCAPQRPGR